MDLYITNQSAEVTVHCGLIQQISDMCYHFGPQQMFGIVSLIIIITCSICCSKWNIVLVNSLWLLVYSLLLSCNNFHCCFHKTNVNLLTLCTLKSCAFKLLHFFNLFSFYCLRLEMWLNPCHVLHATFCAHNCLKWFNIHQTFSLLII